MLLTHEARLVSNHLDAGTKVKSNFALIIAQVESSQMKNDGNGSGWDGQWIER